MACFFDDKYIEYKSESRVEELSIEEYLESIEHMYVTR